MKKLLVAETAFTNRHGGTINCYELVNKVSVMIRRECRSYGNAGN